MEEDPLPAGVREWLVARTDEQPPARIAFVRRPDRESGPLRFFAARVGGEDTGLWSVSLDSHEELPRVDLSGLASGDPTGLQREEEPLLLVCANGRRDRCCARRGLPLFRALDRMAAGSVAWLSTHLGGHRYAAVSVAFPAGACYGYLRPERAGELLSATLERRLLLENLRGRTFLPRVVQAADCFLRRREGLAGEEDVRWIGDRSEIETGRITLISRDGSRFRVMVRSSREEVLVSCSPRKRKEIEEFTLERIELLEDDPREGSP